VKLKAKSSLEKAGQHGWTNGRMCCILLLRWTEILRILSAIHKKDRYTSLRSAALCKLHGPSDTVGGGSEGWGGGYM
jgi:hypothetical protein